MPSQQHTGLVDLFKHRPRLAVDVLRDLLNVHIPEYKKASTAPGEVTVLKHREYRPDVVVMLESDRVEPTTLIVEVQLNSDRMKRWSWPVYLANLRAKNEGPAMLLVVTPDSTAASWSARPIDTGHPNWALAPIVLGPDQVPLMTDPAQAAYEEDIATLSALIHGGRPEGQKVLTAFLEGLDRFEDEGAEAYIQIVLAAFPEIDPTWIEDNMTTEYKQQSRLITELHAKGRAEGEARSILTVLDSRGILYPDETMHRITGCKDLAQLETWLRRALTITSIDELFQDD